MGFIVDSEVNCKDAALKLGLLYKSITTYDTAPAGCWLNALHDGTGKTVYFNTITDPSLIDQLGLHLHGICFNTGTEHYFISCFVCNAVNSFNIFLIMKCVV